MAGEDEKAAAKVLHETFADPGVLGVRARPAALRGLALVWVLLPEWRDELKEVDAGSGPAAVLRSVHGPVLLDGRRGGVRDPAAGADARLVSRHQREGAGRASTVLPGGRAG